MLDALQILFLNNRVLQHNDTYSHAEITLYSGLRAIGANVVIYPWLQRICGREELDPSNWGTQLWSTRGGYNGITQFPYSYDDIYRMRFDLIISTNRFARDASQFLLDAKSHFKCPLAMLCPDDGGTTEWYLPDNSVDIKFRAEIPLDSMEDAYPLPQSIMYPASRLKTAEKIYGAHCWMAGRPQARVDLIHALRQAEGNHFVGMLEEDGVVEMADYLDRLCESKVKYGLRGVGYNSQHFWEGLAAEDVILIAKIEHKIPPPAPEIGFHYVELDMNDVIGQLNEWLDNEEARKKMAVFSREFCYRFHTPKARGRYFLDKCHERFGLRKPNDI